MGFADFIGLDASCDNDNNNNEDNSLHVEPRLKDSEWQSSSSQLKEAVSLAQNAESFARSGEGEDDANVLDMDIEDDNDQQQAALQESYEFVGTVMTMESVNEVKGKQVKDTSLAAISSNGTATKHFIDGSPKTGVKRARMTYVDKQPSVCIIYSSLTRESKRKLMELVQQWSEWQAQNQLSSNEPKDDGLEDGEETYFPALHIGTEKSCTVSFWVDNQGRKENVKYYADDTVPLYDRQYMLGSASVDGSNNVEGKETLEASRCFNCGSYSHSLKECPKPRDNVAINNARRKHSSKRNTAASNRDQVRYYQKTSGKFDDLRAGVLGPETRECLGIGEYDPPPWLHRMREMGYPPGYLDIVEDEEQPSGITIYADEEPKEEYEDGELPERGEREPPQRRMTVEFPGINAPIPKNADRRCWASPTGYSGSDSFKNRSHHRTNHSSETHREHHRDPRWSSDIRDDDPSGWEYGLPASIPCRSPRYSPYDHHRRPRSPPTFGRSLSDRGWRSPVNYDTSPAQSPHSPNLYTFQQSPKYQGSSSYYSTTNASRQARDRHDDWRSHHR